MIYIEVNMMEIEKWLNDVLEKKNKRAMPIITFPAATKLNISSWSIN